MKLGFNTQGTEKDFEEMLNLALQNRAYCLSYAEIGIANCQTLFAVAEYLSKRNETVQVIGIDIPDSPYFRVDEFLKNAKKEFYPSVGYFHVIPGPTAKGLTITVQLGEGRSIDGLIDFCMIDGCHGGNCVKKDFQDMEENMSYRGIVAFHDASEPEQGTQHQPHCGEGIAVRRALKELGLLDDTRPGWKFLKESPGDYKNGGHGFVFVQKV